jgi:hypothetical protein
MRWPFHFGKAAGAESKATPKPAAPPLRRDWASLAPIQRAVGEAPLTAASLEFGRSLAGSEEPALSLEPLGHHRSREGPQGLVTGIANPIQTYASTAELIGRPRRRSQAPVSVQALSQDVAGVAEAPAGSSDGFDEEPEPDLLTRVLPAVAVGAPPASMTASRLTDASRVEVGPLRPIQRSPETAAQAASTERVASETAGQMPAAPPAGTRLNLGLSRRHGLGAPIRTAEAASVQRSTAPPASPVLSPPPQPSTTETPAASEARSAEPQSSPLTREPALDEVRPQASMFEPELAPLPPVRRQSRGGRSEVADESSSVAEPAASVPDAAPLAGGPVLTSAPVEIAAPLGTSPLPIQRQVAARSSSSPAARGPRTVVEPGRTTPTAPLTSRRPPLTSVRLPGEPPLVSVLENQPPRSSAAFGEMPLPAIQRSPALGFSPAAALGAASAPPASRAFDHSPLVWNVQRLTPGETPGEQPAAGGPAAGEGPSAGTPAMAAAPAMAPTGGAAPSGGGSAPHPGESAPASGGGGAPAGGAATHGEKELYELAQSLFDPLMSLFRREVLTERERAGFVTDLR